MDTAFHYGILADQIIALSQKRARKEKFESKLAATNRPREQPVYGKIIHNW